MWAGGGGGGPAGRSRAGLLRVRYPVLQFTGRTHRSCSNSQATSRSGMDSLSPVKKPPPFSHTASISDRAWRSTVAPCAATTGDAGAPKTRGPARRACVSARGWDGMGGLIQAAAPYSTAQIKKNNAQCTDQAAACAQRSKHASITVMRMFCCMQDCCCPQHTDDCVEDEAGTAQPDGGVLPRQSGIKAGTSLRSRVARSTVAAARAAAAKRRRPFMRQAIHCSQVAHYRSALWELQRTIHQQRNL